jgi:hypothetical protein
MKHKLLITAFFVTGFIILGTIAAPTVIADSYSWQITGSTFFVHSYHTYKYCDLLEASSCSASNVNTVAYCQDSPDESPCPDPSNLAYCNIGAHQETCLDTTTPAPPPPLPDLTVNPLPNLTGTAGQPVTFTGTVVNIGNGSANAQFTVREWRYRQNQ